MTIASVGSSRETMTELFEDSGIMYITSLQIIYTVWEVINVQQEKVGL